MNNIATETQQNEFNLSKKAGKPSISYKYARMPQPKQETPINANTRRMIPVFFHKLFFLALMWSSGSRLGILQQSCCNKYLQ